MSHRSGVSPRFSWIFLFALGLSFPVDLGAQEADVIFSGGRIWTGDDADPWAEAVAVTGNRIVAVGSDEDVASFRGSETRVIALDGRFLSSGFIDNHTHFNRAGELLLGINLLEVSDEEGLVAEVRAAAGRRLDDGRKLGSV